MFIKEIIIDGFKSYANRTVVSGFDPSFNAITGLNGSGKSNILDSICFVLGISNLSQVRVNNLQELVYKQGQSRVVKASVTIVFDNREASMSPVGYEQYEEITVTRQVVIGGRNKYLINGHTAQLNRVQNLFHSVQLNVNNPHFLIMQGRITKVCNMKPHEVLGMIEEAAGTRMYESKKKAALKTIARKQIKVDEINKILVEEITPTLEKLRKERSSYIQWSSNNSEMERLSRICVAASFAEAEKTCQESVGVVKSLEDQLGELKGQDGVLKAQLKTKDTEIASLTEQQEGQMSATFKKLEARVNAESKEIVQFSAQWEHRQENLTTEEKTLAELEANIQTNKDAQESKRKQISEQEATVSEALKHRKAFEEEVSALQGQQLGVSVSSGDGQKEKGSLAAQLMESQRQVSAAAAEAEGLRIQAKHIVSEMKTTEKQAKASRQEWGSLSKKLDAKTKELQKLEDTMKRVQYDPEEKVQCETNIEACKTAMADLSEERDSLKAKLARMDFTYSKPTAGFKQERVKGLVANLIEVKDTEHCGALEVCAGGRLYNVVVDTQDTGKLLLEKGKLKRRVTIIPLNKIAARTLSAERVDRAKQLVGSSNARLALELIGYNQEVEAAMRFVFGGYIVCPDSDSAKRVTFHKDIRAPTVTLQGDVFDPRGTLTGGSAPQGGSVLLKLRKLQQVTQKLQAETTRLGKLEVELKRMLKLEQGSSALLERRERCKHEVSLLTARLQQTAFAQIQEQVDTMRQRLAALEDATRTAEEKKATAAATCKTLERSIANYESERANQMKAIKTRLSAIKKKLTTAEKKYKAQLQRKETFCIELNALEEEASTLGQALIKAKANLVRQRQEVESLRKVVEEKKNAFDKASGELNCERTRIQATEKQITQLQKQRSTINKRLSDNTLEQKKVANKIGRCHTEEKDCKRKVEALLKQFEWIASEKHLFGKPHTDYDFNSQDPAAAKTRLDKLKAQQERLGRKINKKVMGMFEKAEQEYEDLMHKRDIIETDKAKIEQVISELDRKKNEALERTWLKVTKDFGSIFSTLLPGTEAKLEPPAGCSVLDGLEVKVAFGGVWKDSLSELSGGQRSLLALSLILAMLLFKPAPMYILDEIDAALDLSHTQNIGMMLKTHFPQSQFIVVSLKEGMFNNANVVFRTKFVDGVSTVSRTMLRTSGAKRAAPRNSRQRRGREIAV